MLRFKAISADDFDKYNKYRAMDTTYASEGVFTTMFIWNSYYNLECAENGEFFFLRFNIRGKESTYFFPIGEGNLRNAIEELSEFSAARGEKLKFMLVTKENKERLSSIFPDRFRAEETRSSFDYVYTTERMISLSGKKLHSKRNHLNFFLDNYNYEYKRVTTPELLEKCKCKAISLVRGKKKNLNSFEEGAMEKYFDNFFRFRQTGGALLINDEIAAMSFGEKLNSETALIQIELADEAYRGAYQAINKLFCENEWKDCLYVNREEDMGIEGLRRAKESYQPQFLVEKYVIEEDVK